MSSNGYYLVNNKPIDNKLHAIMEASRTKTDMQWVFFDDTFAAANRTFIDHSITLKELYRIRAQQLRDSNDYLILNYSGGSDSHNILMTFLQNKIKLDHVVVQWPERLMDKGIYTPNNIDRTNANFHSEWDLVLKKDLEWLGKNFPEIRIEILDWTNSVNKKFYNDDIFEKNVTNLPSVARAQKQNTFSPSEGTLALQGKKVGSIFGVDKPCVVHKENKWYFYFVDTGCMAQCNPDNPYGLEYFYWTPNLPELAIAQAHQMKQYFINNKDKKYLVQAPSERAITDPTYKSWPWQKHYAELAQVAEISKLVCYPNWNFDRFQADKPYAILDGFKMGLRGWDNILSHIPSFSYTQQVWEYHWNSYLPNIDKKFLRFGTSSDTFAACKTIWHEIR